MAVTTTNFSKSAESVFSNHYYKKDAEGNFVETSPSDVILRVGEFYKDRACHIPSQFLHDLVNYQLTKQFSFNSPVYYNADINNPNPQLLACFTAGHEILMASGRYKRIEDVQLGDVIVDAFGDEQVVEQLHVRNYDGPGFEVRHRGSNIPIVATSEHPFMGFKRKSVRCLRAKCCACTDSTRNAAASRCLPKKGEYKNACRNEVPSVEEIPASELEMGDFVLTPSPKLKNKTHTSEACPSFNGLACRVITNVSPVAITEKVYNLGVSGSHTYVVNGVGVHNCFVSDLQDSMESITNHVRRSMLIFKTGAGMGFNIGALRPQGASLGDGGKHIAGESGSSGPLSFMRMFQTAGDVVMSAGKRRAAMWAGMSAYHPDVEKFILSKRGNRRTDFTNMNISVITDDAFVKAYDEDAAIDLQWNGTVWKTTTARNLMRMTAESVHAGGDPGLLFIDTVNRHNTTPRLGVIVSCNPCVTGDTLVATQDGPCRIDSLSEIGEKFNLYTASGIPTEGVAFCTGKKPVYEVTFNDGRILKCTEDHKLVTPDGKVRLCDLEVGDAVNTGLSECATNQSPTEDPVRNALAAIRGWRAGDGGVSTRNYAYFDFYEPDYDLLPKMRKLLHFLGGDGAPQPYRNGPRWRYDSSTIRDLLSAEVAKKDAKDRIPDDYYGNLALTKSYLSWLFSADGSVQGTLDGKGVSVRLASSNLPFLQNVQLLLQYVGINSKVYGFRRDEGYRMLPGGAGSKEWYYCNADHELVITRDNVSLFYAKIGFAHPAKHEKLCKIEESRKRSPYRDKRLSVIKSIKYVGVEPVYDITVDHDEHTFVANGLSISNCGEVVLPPNTSCNLGAIVLYNVLRRLEDDKVIKRDKTKRFKWPDIRKPFLNAVSQIAQAAMWHLDANIDVNVYPDDAFHENTAAIRPTGLGFNGLGELLVACGEPYGSSTACMIGGEIMNEITLSAAEWSFKVVSDNALPPATAFEKEPMIAQMQYHMDEAESCGFSVQAARWKRLIVDAESGRKARNCYWTCLAPTGNTGIAFDSQSSGMEPINGVTFKRNTRDGVLYFADQELTIQCGKQSKEVLEDIYDAFGGSIQVSDEMPTLDDETKAYLETKYGNSVSTYARVNRTHRTLLEIPSDVRKRFVMMHDIHWRDRLNQQSMLQRFTSLSISSTVNVPQNTTVEEIEEIYATAMRDRHLKGITLYRDGSIQFAPLTMTKNKSGAQKDTMPAITDTADMETKELHVPADPKHAAAKKVYDSEKDPGKTEHGDIVVRKKMRRPRRTVGFTIELEFNDGVHHDKYYVTINEDRRKPGRPIEVFISGGKHGENTPAMNQALGRVISGWLQDGAPVRSIVKKLVGIKGDHRARVWFDDGDKEPVQVLSIPDAIGKALQREYMDKREVLSVRGGTACPKCYHNTFVYGADGKRCWVCHNPDCGYTFC